jgi:hypothetical protein
MLAQDNQIIYTTHSPFMVGTDELHFVRVVEIKDRRTGTKVHSTLVLDDPRSIYPLQAALGYELAQSLFGQKRNLVCEGLTDMWMLEGVSGAMREAGIPTMRVDVAITPAQSASKVVVAGLAGGQLGGGWRLAVDPSGRSPSRREGNPAVVVGTIAAMATTTDDEPDCRYRFAAGFRGAVKIFIDQR